MLDQRCVEMGRHYGCTCEFTPSDLEILKLQEQIGELNKVATEVLTQLKTLEEILKD